MQNKTLLMAFMLSAFVHGALILPIFPEVFNFSIEEGLNRMSISMGSIIISKEKINRSDKAHRNSEILGNPLVKESEARNREACSQVPRQFGRSGAEKDNSGKVKNQYFAEIRERIENVKQYPKLAKERGFEGISEIEFVILANGKIQVIELMNSSGYQVLNNAAIDTIKKASPFPPVPEEFGKSWIKLTVPIVFSLKGGGEI